MRRPVPYLSWAERLEVSSGGGVLHGDDMGRRRPRCCLALVRPLFAAATCCAICLVWRAATASVCFVPCFSVLFDCSDARWVCSACVVFVKKLLLLPLLACAGPRTSWEGSGGDALLGSVCGLWHVTVHV